MPILLLFLGLGAAAYALSRTKGQSKPVSPTSKIPIGAYVVIYASSKTGDKGSQWFSDKTEALKYAKNYKDTPGYQVSMYQEKGPSAEPLRIEVAGETSDRGAGDMN